MNEAPPAVGRSRAGWIGPSSRPLRLLLLAAFAAPAILVLAAPWSLPDKMYALCSGLCAQQVSHTLRISGNLLPLDARCTGIYGGFLLAVLYFLFRGKGRATGAPPIRYLVLGVVLIGLMGLDGFNSLFKDLHVWHPYMPDNRIRLISGLGAGFGLAIFILPVANGAIWRNGRFEPIIAGAADLYAIAGIFAAFFVLLQSPPAWLHTPMAVYLGGAVVSVLGTLNLVVAASMLWTDGARAERVRDLLVPAGLAFVFALIELTVFAIFRFALEQSTGVNLRTYLA